MVVDDPAQMVAFVTVVPTLGVLFTVINRVAVFTQPFALVPVTVYVVVVTGDTFIVVPVKPPGCQIYDTAPVPVIDVVEPEQIVEFVTVVPTVGNELTVITRVAVAVHPCELVAVTVYVFASVTMRLAPTPPPGCHV